MTDERVEEMGDSHYELMGQSQGVDYLYNKGSTKLSKICVSVAKVAKEVNNPQILDVGCFGGYLFNKLEEYGLKDFHYTGIDINPFAIAEAWERNKDNRALYYVQDLFSLGENISDITVCSRVLIHVQDIEGALQKIVSATRHAIVLSVSIDDENYIVKRTDHRGSWYHRYMTMETFVGMLDKFNVKVEKTSKQKGNAIFICRI